MFLRLSVFKCLCRTCGPKHIVYIQSFKVGNKSQCFTTDPAYESIIHHCHESARKKFRFHLKGQPDFHLPVECDLKKRVISINS